jgi:hypothetical protein
MGGSLRFYVITLSARDELDPYDFFIHRELGVCAYACAAGGGSDFYDYGGFAADFIIRKISSNCGPGAVDLNVLKYEVSPGARYGPDRLRASIKSADQRLREECIQRYGERLKGRPDLAPVPGMASIAAMLPVEDRLVVLQVGAQVCVHRIRPGQVEIISPPPRTSGENAAGGSAAYPWFDATLRPSVGIGPDFDVLVREELLASGDLFVLTSRPHLNLGAPPSPSAALQILAQNTGELERALVACFEHVADRAPLVVARWIADR